MIANNYSDWLDRSKNQSDYLKLISAMKKEDKDHRTQLFCLAKVIEDIDMEGEGVKSRNTEGDEEHFNPQVLFATSGAVYTDIDNPGIYRGLYVEMTGKGVLFIAQDQML